MSKKRKFIQISATRDRLFALDAAGNVWELISRWSETTGENSSWEILPAEREAINEVKSNQTSFKGD